MRDKKVITILLLSFVFLLILTISYSYSVFNSQITGEEDSKVAVWDIKINESLITGGTQAETHTFDINNMTMNDVSSIREGTFGPGSTVNFYLRFYPLDTDVSIKYVITVDPDIFGNDNIVISDARKTSSNGTITKDGDTYQFGYHRTISYRENCYQCKYACEKRISDITLSDYKGLGRLAPCDFTNEKVSSILVNTSKGEAWIEELIRKNCIVAHERPVQEPVLGDTQLQHPSVKGKARYDFEKYIRRYDGDFEKSMKSVIRNERIRNLPRRLKSYVKRLIR